jgi:hypothetical protein
MPDEAVLISRLEVSLWAETLDGNIQREGDARLRGGADMSHGRNLPGLHCGQHSRKSAVRLSIEFLTMQK